MQATRKGWWFLDTLFAGQLLCRAWKWQFLHHVVWVRLHHMVEAHEGHNSISSYINSRVLLIKETQRILAQGICGLKKLSFEKRLQGLQMYSMFMRGLAGHCSLAVTFWQSVAVLCWGYLALSADKTVFLPWKCCMVWCLVCTPSGLGTSQP